MNKEQLKEALQKLADEKDIDLKASWYNLSEENMQKYLDELNGKDAEAVTLPKVEPLAQKDKIEKTTLNPFGEEIMKVMVPIDRSNPKVKTFTFSINGHRLRFPLGKMAHMPMSFYLGYLDSQTMEMKAQLKQSENHYTEI